MSDPRVRVVCPATTANLGPGFDALGLALGLHNAFTFEAAPPGVVEVEARGPEGPAVARAGAAGHGRLVRAWDAARAALGLGPLGLRVASEVAVPPGRGLGSSATATVAGLLGAAALAEARGELRRGAAGPGAGLDRAVVVRLATELEGHPDNAVPCLLGGLCVAGPGGAVHARLSLPRPPAVVAAVPTLLEKSTEAMRRLLPAQVPFADAAAQVSRVALLVAALVEGRHELLPAALQDRLHEPYRGPAIPGFESVRAAARAAGALGAVLSGAGPTVVAFATDEASAARAGAAMVAAWAERGVEATPRVLSIDAQGARVERTG